MSKENSSMEDLLGQTCILQLMVNNPEYRKMTEKERDEVIKKIQKSGNTYDKTTGQGKGKFNVDDLYSILKLQNKIDCNKTELRKLVMDLNVDKEGRFYLKDFLYEPIISQAVFDMMDKNKDGYISKNELRLAQKKLSKEQILSVMKEIDSDGDGKLNIEEMQRVQRQRILKKTSKH